LPIRDDIKHIEPEMNKVEMAQKAVDRSSSAPAIKAAFNVWWWEDMIDKFSYGVKKRRKLRSKSSPTVELEQVPPKELLPSILISS
jgi:hypothetical protein